MKLKQKLKEKLEKMAIYVALLLIIIFAFSLFKNILKVRKVKEKIEEKKVSVESLEKKSRELENNLGEVVSEEYIEEKLRNDLGFVRGGEIVVVLPEREVVEKLAPPKKVEDKVLPDPIWKRWLKLFVN